MQGKTKSCTDIQTQMNTHWTYVPSSIVFMSLPSAFIFGLLLTEMMTSQTTFRSFMVHFDNRAKWRIWFCCIGSEILVMDSKSPFEMIPLSSRWNTMLEASTSVMNCFRKWSRTCLTIHTGKDYDKASQHSLFTRKDHTEDAPSSLSKLTGSTHAHPLLPTSPLFLLLLPSLPLFFLPLPCKGVHELILFAGQLWLYTFCYQKWLTVVALCTKWYRLFTRPFLPYQLHHQLKMKGRKCSATRD